MERGTQDAGTFQCSEWQDVKAKVFPKFGRECAKNLGAGFKYVLFIILLGEMIQFDEHIFQMG